MKKIWNEFFLFEDSNDTSQPNIEEIIEKQRENIINKQIEANKTDGSKAFQFLQKIKKEESSSDQKKNLLIEINFFFILIKLKLIAYSRKSWGFNKSKWAANF